VLCSPDAKSQSTGLFRLDGLNIQKTQPLCAWLGTKPFSYQLLVQLSKHHKTLFNTPAYVSCMGHEISIEYVEDMRRCLMEERSRDWLLEHRPPFDQSHVALELSRRPSTVVPLDAIIAPEVRDAVLDRRMQSIAVFPHGYVRPRSDDFVSIHLMQTTSVHDHIVHGFCHVPFAVMAGNLSGSPSPDT
jgi:hypothetical protein